MNRKINHKDKQQLPASNSDALFERVVSVLEQARSNVVRAVNSEMIIAYWRSGGRLFRKSKAVKNGLNMGNRLSKTSPFG